MIASHLLSRSVARAGAFAAALLTSAAALAAPSTPAGEDIRDIRGPIAIPPWWRWPAAIAVAAALALAVVLLVRWWRARSAHAPTPVELARRALDEAEGHARAGRVHAWAEIVAETTRGALAVRVGADVLSQTLAELAEGAWTQPPLSTELDADRVIGLLEACDLARFAKASLDAEALSAATATARALVERLYAPPTERPKASALAPDGSPPRKAAREPRVREGGQQPKTVIS